MTAVATEMPRCRSISMKSEVAPFLILLLLTAPATWMAPPKRSSFSVRVGDYRKSAAAEYFVV